MKTEDPQPAREKDDPLGNESSYLQIAYGVPSNFHGGNISLHCKYWYQTSETTGPENPDLKNSDFVF